ncbi:uncharacterized protein [Solanum lycopersicum]|uniref:Uncharacterized protein n=1 Tax=Solanum lycopersicum TaxID=4081 RepID=A0A3Q7GWU0_SOLLC|nr:uncharacterized protein LOC109120477 [Solanum lycopersicum]
MATEILRPQDILTQWFRVSPSVCYRRRNNFGNGNEYISSRSSYGNRKQVVRTEKERSEKKKVRNQPEPLMRRRSASSDDLRPTLNAGKSNGGVVMGQVTILRRGESLDSLNSVYGTGPGQPEKLRKQIQVGLSSADVYAGSAFSNSPSPRALPLPSFFNKKQEDFKSDDFASRDLRRLLRLEH